MIFKRPLDCALGRLIVYGSRGTLNDGKELPTMNSTPRPLIYLSLDPIDGLRDDQIEDVFNAKGHIADMLSQRFEVKCAQYEELDGCLQWKPTMPFNGLAVTRLTHYSRKVHFNLDEAIAKQPPDGCLPFNSCYIPVLFVDIPMVKHPSDTIIAPDSWISVVRTSNDPSESFKEALPANIGDLIMTFFEERLASWGLRPAKAAVRKVSVVA